MAKRRSSVISVLITGDNRELSNTLDDSSSKLATFGKAAGAALAAAGVAFGAFAKTALDAAVEAEAAQFRLATILRNTGLATEEQIVALNAQAQALEKVGVASSGNITVLQSQLATFDLSAKAIEALTPAILDYVIAEKGATATAADFQSAATGLAGALQGQFGALSRVGFVLDDATKEMIKNGTESQRVAALVQVLGSTYDGFNEKARQTAAGGMQVLRNQFEAMRESVGNALLPLLRRLIDWFASNEGRITAFAETAIAGFVTAIDKILGFFGIMRDRFNQVVDFIQWRIGDFRRYIRHNLQEPFDNVRERIVLFVDTVKSKLGELRSGLITGLPEAVTGIGDKITELTPKFAAAFGFIIEKLDEFGQFWDANLKDPVDQARIRIGLFVDTVKSRLAEFKDAVPGAVKALTDFFAEVRALSDDPKGLGKKLGDALANALRTALESLAGLGEQVGTSFVRLLAGVDWFKLGMDSVVYILLFINGLIAGFFGTDWYTPLLRAFAENWRVVLIGVVSIMFMPAKWAGAIARALARIPFIGRILSWLVTGLSTVGTEVKKWIGARAGLIVGEFSTKFLGALRGGGPPLVQGFVNFLLFIPRAILRAFDDAAINVAIGFGRFGTALGNGIRGFVGRAAEFLSFLLTPFRAFGKTLIDDLFLLGRNIINALMSGIQSMAGALANLVRSIGRSVWEGLSRLWKISSPSKVFMDLGRQVGVGLALGIESTERMIRDAASIAGGAASAEAMLGGIGGGARAGSSINITVNGAIDAEGTARQVLRVLQDAQRRTGVRL
jgi:hypothetical protein